MSTVNFVIGAQQGALEMPKGQQPRIPFKKACEWAGGEDVLKNALDPNTGKPLFSRNWRDPRSRWYNYKTRGFPAYLLLPIVVARLETEQPGLEGEAIEATRKVIEAYKVHGANSPIWTAIQAILKAALENYP